MATPRFAWGIDVGNRALKAVKLVRDGSGAMRVDDVDVIEHEHILSDAGDNKEALVTTALNAFAAKHPEKGGAVAIGVSGQSSFARFIKLPPVEPKKIPEIVRFEAIQQIPFPLDDVEWAYQLFQDEGSPDVEVGIFAMRKELVNQYIGNFTNAGLNVQVVQMNPLAVYNAMRYDERIKGTTMIVDVGSENTDLIIAEGEQVWLRSIPVGGNNFTEALVKQFKLKFPKAEELKRNAATSKYTRQILQAMRPVFDSLVAEIQRSIGFYASVHRDSRISRVIALGGTFRLPGLMKFLQMQLQLDVQRFDALGAAPPADARVATLLNDNVLSVVSPYGLALQAMGEGKITSSLLPLTIRRERMWREKTKWFAAAAALFIAGTGVAVGRYYYDRLQYDSAEPARREIATNLTAAQALAAAWTEIEQAGAPERTNIASLQSLTQLRQIQAELQIAIDKALPEPAPKAEGPRAERKVVLVNDQIPAYYEDLSPALATGPNGYFTMSTPEFILNATATPGAGGGGYAGYGGGTGGIPSIRAKALTGGAAGGAPSGIYMPPGATVAGGAAPAEGAPAVGKQRGFLLTLTCTTPMGNWNEIANAVSTSLIEQTKAKIGEKQPFRFERVELVSQVNLKNLPPEQRQQVLPGRRNPNGVGMPVGVPRRAMMGRSPFGASDMMETEGYVQPRGFGRRPTPPPNFAGRRTPTGAGQRPGTPGATGATDPNAEDQQVYHPMPPVDFAQLKAGINGTVPEFVDPNQPLEIKDPVNGEDATNDNRLTFLVAVVLDPAPLAPPAPAAPAEGGETGGDGSTPPTPPAGEEAASAQ